MAADSTTDDTAEGNAIGGSSDSNDATVTNAGVNQPHLINLKGFPSSKDMENEKGNSLHLESMEVREKEASHHGENAAEILMQEPEKPDIQSVGIQSKVLADPHEENDIVRSPGAAQKIDEKDPKDPNQEQDSVTLKVEAQQLAYGIATKEMDVDNGLRHVESSSVVGPMVGKLISKVNEIEDKCFSKETPGLELVTEDETKKELDSASTDMEVEPNNVVELEFVNQEQSVPPGADMKTASNVFLLDKNAFLGDETETEENQAAFMRELEAFHKERFLEFKPPKFYGEPLNCLKLWKAVIKLGGYEQVTACKLWRQVGESFNPPKTCTTVSWTFRGFYEKALLEYEKHKMHSGELPSDVSFAEPSGTGNQAGHSQSSGSGRARRDAAARAMQGWHSQRLLSNGEVGDSIIKDKNSISTIKREKQLKSVGLLKRKKVSPVEHPVHIASLKTSKPQLETMVVDIGAPADWVKINVQRTKDCFEVYALVPGLLREEVRVQSDPAGRLVISGEPEQLDNPWGVTPFKKVVSLPSRIDPHQTSAVVTLHGQLFVRVPFEQPDI